MGIIAARAPARSGIQVETVPKEGRVSADFAAINLDAAPSI